MEDKSLIYEGDWAECVANLLPSGSVAAVAACSEDAARESIKKLRRVKITARFIKSDSDVDYINASLPDADVRLIVTVGGEREASFGKMLGKIGGLPVFTVLDSPAAITALNRICDVKNGNVLSLCDGVAPIGAGISEQIDNTRAELPAAFGGICAAALGLFDCESYMLMTGKEMNRTVREQAYAHIYNALDIAARGRRYMGLPRELAYISLKLSELSEKYGYGFVRGAADDCARTARMLFGYEERKPLMRGEFAFLFGSVLCRMYREFITAPHFFCPPPDNNLRAERLSEYLGFDEFTAARAAMKKPLGGELAAYRVGEYKDELLNAVNDAEMVFSEGKKLFKRMYSDDGYRVRDIVDSADVKCIVALAPDSFNSSESFLSVMREIGFLDRYL